MLPGTAPVGAGAACVGVGGTEVASSPAALVVIGVGGPMVLAGGVMEFVVEFAGGAVVMVGD